MNADVGLQPMMAAINTKNVHRSNLLLGHAYGTEFVYDEMSVVDPNTPASFAADAGSGPQPGEGPSKEDREAGFYDAVFIGIAKDGRKVRVAVKGDKDPLWLDLENHRRDRHTPDQGNPRGPRRHLDARRGHGRQTGQAPARQGRPDL